MKHRDTFDDLDDYFAYLDDQLTEKEQRKRLSDDISEMTDNIVDDMSRDQSDEGHANAS